MPETVIVMMGRWIFGFLPGRNEALPFVLFLDLDPASPSDRRRN
jgi:hypothetical protein